MNIVVLDGYTINPGDLSWEGVAALGALTVYDRTANEEVLPRIADAEMVLVNKVALGREIIEALSQTRYIGILATGVDEVDLFAAEEKGIVVTNIPAYSTDAVAQHTIALLLEISNQVGRHNAAVKAGRWAKSPDFCFSETPLVELAGKTIGCIGFGAIGRRVGEVAKALGMRVLATGSRPTPAGQALADYVGLEQLLQTADVVSLHCPLTEETRGMMGRENLAKMKQDAILLNTARGPLVDEQSLADALNEGKLYAAGVDVVSSEPIRADNPLLSAKNCVMTPHIAWAPLQARRRLVEIAVENLAQFLAGKPQNVVTAGR